MKFVIEITEIDKQPEDWTNFKSWPGVGIYKVKGDDSLYHVYERHQYSSGVDYIPYPELLLRSEYEDRGELISESLLLKAIAAASQAKALQ